MKEWKTQTGANSNKSWNNKCTNINCPDYVNNYRVGNCGLGINFRGCDLANKSKKYFMKIYKH